MERELITPRALLVAHPAATLPDFALELMQSGLLITVVRQFDEALAQLDLQAWDAVVIEPAPDDDSIALIREINWRSPDVATILLVEPQSPLLDAALNAGAYDCLLKPLSLPLLYAALNRAQERRWLRQQLAAPRRTGNPKLAHDANNQLSAILGLAQLCVGDPALPADLRSDLQEIIVSARRLRDMLRSG